MVREFLGRVDLPVESACFDVPGPVLSGRAKLTNLPWILNETTLKKALGLKSVRLMNDLEATANAVPHLVPADVHTLSPGRTVSGGAVAVIAPGTGLGEAFLTWEGSRYHAHASEGGHCDFAPTDPTQIELLQYLRARFDHVSFERVCSGIGIPNIYRFFRDTGHAPESPDMSGRLAAADDWTPLIIEGALDPKSPDKLCAATLELFVSILGAETGNLALKTLATGGVYLGGGISPRILPALEDGRFIEAFRRKGRFAQLLGDVPVHVLIEPVPLIGAAAYGLAAAQ
jgi:glucokinase